MGCTFCALNHFGVADQSQKEIGINCRIYAEKTFGGVGVLKCPLQKKVPPQTETHSAFVVENVEQLNLLMTRETVIPVAQWRVFLSRTLFALGRGFWLERSGDHIPQDPWERDSRCLLKLLGITWRERLPNSPTRSSNALGEWGSSKIGLTYKRSVNNPFLIR